jgi:hypothetical protein
MAKVLIGCKLPNGIILENPLNPDEKVTLKGLNRATIIGSTHVTTEVDADFWDLWKSTNPEFSALKNGAIFEAKDKASAKDKAKDTDKTGFEKMDPKDKKHGVKPADDKE